MWSTQSATARAVAQAARRLAGARTLASVPKKAPHPNESFLQGTSAVYLEQMYDLYKQDPSKVDSSLATYFRNVDSGMDPGMAFQPFPGLTTQLSAAASSVEAGQNIGVGRATSDTINVMQLIRAFQTRGHEHANLDPLGILKPQELADLDYTTYGFTEADLDREFNLSGVEKEIKGILDTGGPIKLRDILDTLKQAYCSNIGLEYMHITDREKCNFIRERFEKPNAVAEGLSKEERLQILERLTFAVMWEFFLSTKWNTAKRFGLEGAESFIPGFKSLIDQATLNGVENVVIGMPHRGRLNVIANVVRKDLYKIFLQFKGLSVQNEQLFKSLRDDYAISGDVKYHLGMTYQREYPDGRKVELSLAANPSHLEAVDPVVVGKARAKQYYDDDVDGDRTMPVLIHGDAAFCGQGVVYETMHMSALPDYKTGGAIHIVVNNQIGFTTDPYQSRSTRYCTDLGRAFDCPIFHVNADDPEAVAYIFKVAADYRQKYKSDVIIDVVGYRRNGHNEMDQPLFTQPKMYQIIKKTPNVLDKYTAKAIETGLCDQAHVATVKNMVMEIYEDEFRKSTEPNQFIDDNEWIDSKWEGQTAIGKFSKRQPTRVDEDVLRGIGEIIFQPPEGFQPHRTIKKLLNEKLNMTRKGEGIDWGCAELLAYGSLLLEGKHVRVSGQDSQRGTFSHRHAVLHDQNEPYGTWVGLNELANTDIEAVRAIGEGNDKIANITVCNSSLSEYGIMGFELGYALEDPNALVIWEAQFGDFSNGAQIIVDQFISCGETKWNRQCGLTLFLPHGYDGQGPEHSSCRIERFLQLSDEDPDQIPEHSGREQSMAIQNNNWQVCNVTTPAQIFHLLRRQVHRGFRKPLVIATPKSMLKDDLVRSDIEEFSGPDAYFHRVLLEVDPEVNATPDEDIRKVIFCVGKLYYELANYRKKNDIKDVAIIRIEQITPFPFDRIAETYQKYSNAKLVFAQEEPKNMGTWYFCDDRIYTAIRKVRMERGDPVDNEPELRAEYIGRSTMASPAVGYGGVHALEQQDIIERAFAE
ncbi:2-oxoglutarate dehydrogenase, mitochondrial [Hondaea fermentalgiana]|uniref:2-oxoglutarate dehydrogenase, mitochondrial n=1 Tax=Hondaea fermentalgiana TaxID=2315210 RepID=A0A2R5GKF3_9STRA|nr:2-oxoglutarate dehydrogenase, mitochondrial [Hondaea fermentalgiana]|eukprot:GBG29103.1 2-oxoglutarate dehydrogenase, mitochondrial [Hondaea fermentalgiana]